MLCALVLALLPACEPSGAASSSAASRSPAATTTTPGETSTGSAALSTAAPDPAPTTAPAGPEAQAEVALAGLDGRSRVLQLFVVGVPADDLARGAALAERGVGGLFLAGRPVASSRELAALTGQWQEAAGPGLWVAADQEGGAVQSLKGEGFPLLPSAREQGRLPRDRLSALVDGMGAALASAGVNLDLAPVADIVPAGTEAANPPIGVFDRQYGATAAEVVPVVRTVVDRLAAHGVTATLKHFPGLGRVTANTDDTADVVDTVTTADDEQVAAFGTLAQSPARPFVMTSSAVYERIDPAQQAAFSPAVLQDLLRDRLGFAGPIISDDLGNAEAVADVSPGERAVRFLDAGGTLVLTVNPDLVTPMVDAVLERQAADPAFAAEVEQAVRVALVAKAEAGLLP